MSYNIVFIGSEQGFCFTIINHNLYMRVRKTFQKKVADLCPYQLPLNINEYPIDTIPHLPIDLHSDGGLSEIKVFLN